MKTAEYRKLTEQIDALQREITTLKKQRKALGMPGQRVDSLELSIRAYNVMTSSGIRTVAELTTWSRRRLLGLKNCGMTTVQEIESVLRDYGLHLSDD